MSIEAQRKSPARGGAFSSKSRNDLRRHLHKMQTMHAKFS